MKIDKNERSSGETHESGARTEHAIGAIVPDSENEIISCYDKRFEDLTLADDFMFKVVFSNPKICKQLIEIILKKKINRIVSLESEKALKAKYFSHGVRFDVYIEGTDEVIDIEIQRGDKDDLAKRARSYQGNIDAAMLKKGKAYSTLKESYVVFFCTFDPFKLGIPIYKVRQSFEDAPDEEYHDGTHKIFYNCTAFEKCPDTELKAVLKLLMGQEADTNFAREITQEVKEKIENTAIRSEFMDIEEIIAKKTEQFWNSRFAEGERNNKIATARKALECNIPRDIIANITGLTVAEISAL